jgi:thiamine-phosphate pyrophosphorylase
MSKLVKKGLYAITPNIAETDLLLQKVEQALQGGSVLLQYRDKISHREETLLRAKAIHQLCLRYNVPLIINDDPELALTCQAEGVHLGQSDGSIQRARELLGKNVLIGATCHHKLSLAISAEQQGADYVAFGRFFNSSTKPGAPLAPLKTLADAKAALSIPVVAIGGIHHGNAKTLVNNGADYLAVVEHVFGADNIAESCQRFATLF